MQTEGAWAEALVDEDWPRFLKSIIRRSAYLSTLAYTAHGRFVLNRHLASGSRDDPALLIKNDQRALAKLPPHLGQPFLTGLQARLAVLAGDRKRAAEYLRKHCDLTMEAHCVNEAAFARHALGRLTSGSEGEALCREAEQTLRDLGFADPGAIWPLHFPEIEA